MKQYAVLCVDREKNQTQPLALGIEAETLTKCKVNISAIPIFNHKKEAEFFITQVLGKKIEDYIISELNMMGNQQNIN